MQTPYALFGLGRTNNYVEVRAICAASLAALISSDAVLPANQYHQNLFIGSTIHTAPHFTSLEGVIPNSQVVITPPRPGLDRAETVSSWTYQLYLHPGEYVPWVTLSVVVATIGLAIVVGTLHVREKVSRCRSRGLQMACADPPRESSSARGRGGETQSAPSANLVVELLLLLSSISLVSDLKPDQA